MKPLLYYFPKNEKLNVDDPSTLPEWVRDLAGAGATRAGVMRGPDGGAGTVVWFPPSPVDEVDENLKIGYYPELQTWTAGPGYWVGYYTNEAPVPDDLMRGETIGGYQLRLGDGNVWVAPVARFADGQTNFPKRIGWGPDGKMVEKILPRYEDLCQTAQNIFDFLTESDTPETANVPVNPDTIETAAECLQLNYAMERVAMTALNLLDSKTVPLIVAALVDLPNAIAWIQNKKKEEQSGSDIDDGETGELDLSALPDCGCQS